MSMATARTKTWTLRELHSLPDDGNKYELVHGELFVTPAPAPGHEVILARLTEILRPFVAANNLGVIYHPRAVVRFKGSEVEPDLMVRQPPTTSDLAWEDWPIPILVVEVVSPFTKRRDRVQKRNFYLEAGVSEYWIIDAEDRSVAVVRPEEGDRLEREAVGWCPLGASEALSVDIGSLFA